MLQAVLRLKIKLDLLPPYSLRLQGDNLFLLGINFYKKYRLEDARANIISMVIF